MRPSIAVGCDGVNAVHRDSYGCLSPVQIKIFKIARLWYQVEEAAANHPFDFSRPFEISCSKTTRVIGPDRS